MTHRRFRPAGLAVLLTLALASCGSTNPSSAPASEPSGSQAAASQSLPGVSGAPTQSGSPAPAQSAAAVSCSDTSPAPSFSPQPMGADDPNAAEFAQIESAVETIRGIQPSRAVPRYLLDRAAACAYIRQLLAREAPPELIATTEQFDKLLDLVPANASLEHLYVQLIGSQVLGKYDEIGKLMYVVSMTGTIGPLEEITYAHEFDHALQDQQFGLTRTLGTAQDQGDQKLARSALVEGDATLLMSLWAQKHLTPAQLIQVAGSSDPASQAALDAAPPILRETLLWPYTAGLSLALGAYQTSASFAGVDALWRNPPDTSEQLIHPDKLASREPAIAVAFPADFAKRLGAGWKVALQDTLGEEQLNIVMRTGNPQAGADPAAGWGGDRVALVLGPHGAAGVVVDTQWDNAAAAGNALGQLQMLVQKLNGDGKRASVLAPSATRVVVISADSAATMGAIANVLGLAG